MWLWRRLVLLGCLAGAGLVLPDTALRAQQQQQEPTPQTEAPQTGSLRSPVLTIDPEALFEQSLFGQRVLAEVQAETAALAAENRRIEAALTEEERSLTERRPDMEVSAFREAAAEFDERVQGIRQAQDAKERALEQSEAQGREAFLTAAQPILGRLMLERGAAVILDRRSVFLGFGAIDITNEAVAAINAEIGDGAQPGD